MLLWEPEEDLEEKAKGEAVAPLYTEAHCSPQPGSLHQFFL